ncbi:DUF459 domain-containing protein [Parafrankia elaeagni]|uniref:DUF459 domain-containing protein n=1 Tax=Parafrankia elaeagni TaxID=222534 RepID=UPI00036A5D66|nr:hypothetical protein [Parafrankia elaeagni]
MGIIGWMFAGAIVLAVIALTAGRNNPDEQRVALWGDSLAWESRDAFVEAAQQDGSTQAQAHTWGGTAPCDWLDDMRRQGRRWKPTVAVLSFSGNTGSECMRDRDLLTAYRNDVTEAVEILTRRGTEVILVDAPPRRDQAVDADGLTALDRLWRDIASMRSGVRVAPVGQTLTDKGLFVPRLPCGAGETCDADGLVTVRSPDGVHFCPVVQPPMTACPVRSFGAERYGRAMAEAARVDDTPAP